MVWGRFVLSLIGLILAIIVAFKGTPDLDKVQNKFIYRFYLMMGLTRGWTFMWFTMFGVFPLD